MRYGATVLAALGALAAPPPAYTMAPNVQPVHGTTTAPEAPQLKPGPATYADTLAPGEKKYYAVTLDDESSAYVSAVAAPHPGTALGLRDGIAVSLQTPDGTPCGTPRHHTFLSEGGPYPLADTAERVVKAGGPCRAAGTYRFVLERGDAAGGDPAPVPVELAYMTAEPVDGPTAQGGWPSGAGHPMPQGVPRKVTGGTGFNDAAEVGDGVWADTLRPGETRFYRVSVDEGEQLFADAEFGGLGGRTSYTVSGVRLGLNNGARGYVLNRTGGYKGTPTALSLAAAPTTLPGWQFLQVSVNPRAGRGEEAVPVTLRVDVAGAARPPGSSGQGHGGVGGVAVAAPGRPHNEALRVVGYAGVGTGAVLILGLGVWALLARRRARSAP
ncbi:hypothetical protein [Streptomyces morookaense]|uniref:Uncharacterized protein n=1 Tax=Streptomyces morookaense TaxID=1970 RepID=A0A7Y7B2Y9_STRMO|nr:hypothetical protein [Streptomyces morookaense]NVK78083.1 hypothetical protein [Streptomyces morookaense]GHF15835.1 hypothetical protein GCM10010359_16580 [Streptomyces morookaense]